MACQFSSYAPAGPPPARCALLVAALALALLGGCGRESAEPRFEEAFVARKTIELHKELKPRAPVVTHLELGARVLITGRRRRFVRVRTTSGVEGWTQDTKLVTPEVRELMQQLRRQTRSYPSQGTMKALWRLNVHLEPYRWSPTIYQLREDEPVELLDHRLVDRIPEEPEPGKAPPAPIGLDDWYLVRLENGQPGWLLTQGVYAAIPEEVAQYAERRRITSYFKLGEVNDGGEVKLTWLWTQTGRGKHPHDFDRIRVFMWSRRRDRYETIKLERGLTGFLPIEIHGRVESGRKEGPGFSILVEDEGRRVRRTYVHWRNRVYLAEETPAPPPRPPVKLVRKPPPEPPPPTLLDRLKNWWTSR